MGLYGSIGIHFMDGHQLNFTFILLTFLLDIHRDVLPLLWFNSKARFKRFWLIITWFLTLDLASFLSWCTWILSSINKVIAEILEHGSRKESHQHDADRSYIQQHPGDVKCCHCSFPYKFSSFLLFIDPWTEGKAWTPVLVCREMHFCQQGNTHTDKQQQQKANKNCRIPNKYCLLCVKMESLEQMVDMTTKLFECDRDEMYSYILRLCSKSPLFVLYFILCPCVWPLGVLKCVSEKQRMGSVRS